MPSFGFCEIGNASTWPQYVHKISNALAETQQAIHSDNHNLELLRRERAKYGLQTPASNFFRHRLQPNDMWLPKGIFLEKPDSSRKVPSHRIGQTVLARRILFHPDLPTEDDLNVIWLTSIVSFDGRPFNDRLSQSLAVSVRGLSTLDFVNNKNARVNPTTVNVFSPNGLI